MTNAFSLRMAAAWGLVACLCLAAGNSARADFGEAESAEFLLDLRGGRGPVGVGMGSGISGEFRLDLRGITGPSLFGRSAESGLFTVNLLGRAGGLAVSGRVYDGNTGAGLGGVTVQLGAQSAPTDAQGNFGFASVAIGQYPLRAATAGYGSFEGSLTVPGGATVWRDVVLYPASAPGTGPRVTSLTCPYPGFLHFLDGVGFTVTFTANVDWAGHPPGKVQFLTPRGLREAPTCGSAASQTFDMGADFGPNGKLRAVAVSSDGTRSPERQARLIVAPSPLPSLAGGLLGVSQRNGRFAYNTTAGFNLEFFNQGIDAGLIPEDIPVFGQRALRLQFIPQMECEIGSDGRATFKFKWSDLEAGEVLDREWGRDHNLKKIIALLEDYAETGRVDKRRLPNAPVSGLDMSFYPILGGTFQFDAGTLRWVPQGFSAGLAGEVAAKRSWPFVFMAGPIPVPAYAAVGVEVSADLVAEVTRLEPLALNGNFGLHPYVRGSLGAGVNQVLAVEGWLGGGAELQLQWPAEPALRDYGIYLNGGVTVYAFLWRWENELLRWEWPAGGARPRLILADGAAELSGAPLPRDYLSQPHYGRFFGRRGGRAPKDGGGLEAKPRLLQENVFPYSEPACSARGTNCLLVWLVDDPARAPMDRTAVVFSRYNGAEWSAPLKVADDGTADFHPQVLAFADGWGLTAWENERTRLPDNTPFAGMKTNLEISVAWFDPASGSWLPQLTLTTNAFLDRSPKLAGPARDSVLLTWVANPTSHLTGNAAEPNQIWSARWDGVAWSSPEVVATLTNALIRYDLAYDGTNGNLVMCLDMDNVVTNVNDQELFRIPYAAGAWGGVERLTEDELPDANPQLAMNPAGQVVLAWLRGDELCSAVDFNLAGRQVIRTNGYSSNLADFKLAISDGGGMAALWSEPSAFASDLWAVLYDPVFQRWGAPRQLTADAETELGTTGAMWGTNLLLAVYDRRLIGPTNSLTTDLYVLDYALGGDLALRDLRASPGNPGPGESATLQTTAVNAGDRTVADVSVAFYLGHPLSGGVEVGRVTVAGTLAAGEAREVSFGWTLPATNGSVKVYAMIDPALALTDVNRSNNVVALELAQADLTLESVTWSSVAGGAISVIARVGNLGVVASLPTILEFRLGGASGTNLFSAPVGTLAPGESVEVSFVWDATGLSDGLRLFAGLGGGSGWSDFNRGNNSMVLSVQRTVGEAELRFGPMVPLPGGLFQITLTNEPGRNYEIQTSTNLATWEPWFQFLSTNSPAAWKAPGETNQNRRFYRALRP